MNDRLNTPIARNPHPAIPHVVPEPWAKEDIREARNREARNLFGDKPAEGSPKPFVVPQPETPWFVMPVPDKATRKAFAQRKVELARDLRSAEEEHRRLDGEAVTAEGKATDAAGLVERLKADKQRAVDAEAAAIRAGTKPPKIPAGLDGKIAAAERQAPILRSIAAEARSKATEAREAIEPVRMNVGRHAHQMAVAAFYEAAAPLCEALVKQLEPLVADIAEKANSVPTAEHPVAMAATRRARSRVAVALRKILPGDVWDVVKAGHAH
jgi:hypothetical protein